MGGVQLFQLLITVIRAKFIAIILGTAGMGVSALLIATLSLINQATSLGLSLGAMRSISQSHQSQNTTQIARTTTVFRKMVLLTGLFGALVCALGASLWSNITFGNSDYFYSFIIFAPVLLLMALSSAEVALLQGTGQLKKLATTSLLGSLVGLLIGIPFYYLFGTYGIAPAMLALNLSTYLSNRYFTRSIPTNSPKIPLQDALKIAKPILLIGLAMTLSTILATLTTYTLNLFLRYAGSLSDVGLFQAATSITTQYSSIIFTALIADYLPRLSAVADHNDSLRPLVNQQGEIILLLITPLILIILAAAPLLISLLMSSEFLPAVPTLRWMALALLLKAASFTLSYIAFAKGDRTTFLLLEGIAGSLLNLGCSTLGFILFGLEGLGIAMFVSYALYLFITLKVVHTRYEFTLSRPFLKLFCTLFATTLSLFIIAQTSNSNALTLAAGIATIILTIIYCYRQLNNRIQLYAIIKKFLQKKN